MTILGTTTTFQLGSGPILNSIDGNGVIWRVNQDGFTGGGEPATNLDPQANIRARGTWTGDAFTGGRTLGWSGTITAPTPALLNAAIDSLINAVSATGFTLTVTESGVPYTHFVRRSGETLTPKITNLMAAYSIQVHADDPRKLGATQTGSTGPLASAGGFTIPFTIPFTISATTVSGVVSLTNPGNTTGPVLIRLDGPVSAPSVAHTNVAGQTVTWASSLVLAAGEFLIVDMDNQISLGQGQSNRAAYITQPGWSGFEVGLNTWTFLQGASNPTALMTVTAIGARK